MASWRAAASSTPSQTIRNWSPREAGHRVGRADPGHQPRRHPDQELVADGVSPDLVDVLELVEVHEQHGGGQGLADECVLETIEEQRPVREPGQGVVQGGAAQLVLELSRIGHVGDHRERALDGPAEVVERRCRDPERAPSPVRVVVVDLVAFRLSLRGRGPGAGRVRRRQEIAHRELADSVRVETQDLEQPVVGVHRSTVRREDGQSLLGVVCDRAVPRLGGAQRRLGAHPVVDVAQVPQDAADGGVEEVARDRLHPPPGALDAAHPQCRGLDGALAEHPFERSQGLRAILGVDLIRGDELDEVLGGPTDQRAQRRRAVADLAGGVGDQRQIAGLLGQGEEEALLPVAPVGEPLHGAEVLDRGEDTALVAVLVVQHRAADERRHRLRVGTTQHPLGHPRAATGEEPVEVGAVTGIRSVHEVLGSAAHQLLGRSADQVAEGRVGVGQPAHGVPLHLRHRGQLELCPTEHGRLAERRFQATQVVDVDRVADDGSHVGVVAVIGQHLPDQPPVVGRVGEAVLHHLAAGAADEAVPGPPQGAPVTRVGQRQQRGSDQLLAGPPDLPNGAGGRRRQHTVVVRRPGDVGGLGEQRLPEPLSGRGDRLIEAEQIERGRYAVGVPVQRPHQTEPPRRPVGDLPVLRHATTGRPGGRGGEGPLAAPGVGGVRRQRAQVAADEVGSGAADEPAQALVDPEELAVDVDARGREIRLDQCGPRVRTGRVRCARVRCVHAVLLFGPGRSAPGCGITIGTTRHACTRFR